MKLLAILVLSVLTLSGCSSSIAPSTSGGTLPSGAVIDPSFDLSFPFGSGDTAWVRSSEDRPSIFIMAKVAGIPTNGMQIYYREPVTDVNEYAVSMDSGKAGIPILLPRLHPKRDTSLNYEFQGYYQNRA